LFEQNSRIGAFHAVEKLFFQNMSFTFSLKNAYSLTFSLFPEKKVIQSMQTA